MNNLVGELLGLWISWAFACVVFFNLGENFDDELPQTFVRYILPTVLTALAILFTVLRLIGKIDHII